jgi:hypothetical protein
MAASQPWIAAVEQSGSRTHIAGMGSVLLCARMKKLTAFVELKSAVRGESA